MFQVSKKMLKIWDGEKHSVFFSIWSRNAKRRQKALLREFTHCLGLIPSSYTYNVA
jgi:hypothetical protein